MKKVISLLAAAMMLASCGTTSSGAFSGAMFGSMIGSAIGGISGGPRGSDIGTLVGMATGAMTGAAAGHAAETARRQRYSSTAYAAPGRGYEAYGDDGGAERSEQPIYDDVITMDTPSPRRATVSAATPHNSISIENARFINKAGTVHIAKGEQVKVSFEIRNISATTVTSIVPTVEETTGNSRLLVSPAILVESLGAGRAVRYTAYISAQKNLRKGTAHYRLSVKSGGDEISNVVEFDVPLG